MRSWSSRMVFGANSSGRILRSSDARFALDGVPRTVIGVMAPDFHFMGRTQAWVPSVLTPAQWTIRQFHSFTVVARLRPGVSLTQARAELDTLAGQLSTAYPFSTDYPFDPVLSLDWRVIAFAAALAVLAAVAVGIGPALPVTKAATFDSLRTRSAGSGSARARASLVVLQVGLSVVLLAAAVLFARTVRNLEQREIGLSDPLTVLRSE